jgi:hypothetical protein
MPRKMGLILGSNFAEYSRIPGNLTNADKVLEMNKTVWRIDERSTFNSFRRGSDSAAQGYMRRTKLLCACLFFSLLKQKAVREFVIKLSAPSE